MKKGYLLNQPLSGVIAGLGHTDMLVIADAGLPIPPEPQRIDLALSRQLPTLLETLKAVTSEMTVEGAVLAEEIKTQCPELYEAVVSLLGVAVTLVSHEAFKTRTRAAKAVVRTGKCTPFANIILVSGVAF